MLIHDGAYGTLLARHLLGGETVDDLAIRAPGLVIDAHRAYLDAGAQALQTNSFLVHARGSQRRRRLLIDAAVSCAREAIEQSPRPVELLGTVGPVGSVPRDWWPIFEQLLEAQVDAVLCETIAEAATAAACVAAWRDVAAGVHDVSLLLGCTVSPSRGVDAWRWVLDIADVAPDEIHVGLNCCEGPNGLRPVLEQLCDVRGTAWTMPSAGRPDTTASGEPVWPLGDGDGWAQAAAALVAELPVSRVGGCCGSGPDSIAALDAIR